MGTARSPLALVSSLAHAHALALALALSAALVGCGGGSDEPPVFFADSGVAQKGPLVQGSLVTVNELSATNKFLQNGKSYSFQVADNWGRFNVGGVPFSSSYLLTTAQGYYFDELSGDISHTEVTLHGLSNILPGQSNAINVNVLSSFTKDRTLRLLSASGTPPTFAAARDQAQSELLGNFFIHNHGDIFVNKVVNSVRQPSEFTNLNLSTQRLGDQVLAAYSAVLMQLRSSVVNLSTFIAEVEADLSGDGVINGSSIVPNNSSSSSSSAPLYVSSTSTRSLFCSAFRSTNFELAAATLNRFYGTSYTRADLAQWVDTSGCVDQVINRYKFVKTDVAPGSPGRSPVYQASANDVGKCVLIGASAPLSTAELYYNGAIFPAQSSSGASRSGNPIMVRSGDSFVLATTSNYSGSYSTYLQRFNPTSGSCLSGPRTAGLANLIKFTSVVN
jgi:hypothetical protein